CALSEFMAGLLVISALLRQSRLLHADLTAVEGPLALESQELQSARTHIGIPSIVGKSQKMQQVFETIQKVSRSNATVLLRGESGTGKELVARAIHQSSARADRPFVVINCAALPETLIESELFGHEKGSFTGAVMSREGRFEQADGGTIFLDEIGEISRHIQVKLLRFLQERKFERVGGKRTLSVDVRIIAATNRDLESAVAEGHFREDLYYRLNVLPIYLPPLRERKEDIPLLVGHFLSRFNAENGKRVKLSSAAMDLIMGYSWPGNVRELENCIERIVIMAEREVVSPEEVALPWGHFTSLAPADPFPLHSEETPQLTLVEVEKRQIEEALRKCGGIQARAARLLGISQRQIGYKIKKFGIKLET
ncbi:MAG: sigma 54-interacting transcriptional regulator, partial [candidate division WOR-3 bacterium]